MANLARNPFNPLLIGAIAVIIALAAFLFFRDSTGSTRQAGIESPPTTTSPNTPSDRLPARQPVPQGPGAQ